MTHGVTLISSTLYVDSTQIYFTEDIKQRVRSLFLENLDTGFFNLYLFSDLHLSNQTQVRNLLATKNAVLSASALSNVYTKNSVVIAGNEAQNDDGQTFLLQNT